MKIKNLLICGALLAPTMFGATVANADQTYPDADKATTDAIIQFEKDDQPADPVDPDDPGETVDPVDPSNQTGGDLMITYASNLDFGIHKNTETSFSALGDEMKDGTFKAPFISVKDSRGSDRQGWSLTAKIDGEFKDSQDNVLQGAEVTYSNMYSGKGENTAPNVVTNEVALTDQETTIAGAGATNGSGQHSIGLGTLSENSAAGTTNGVTLTVPKGTTINADQYKTTITYNLTADPFSAQP